MECSSVTSTVESYCTQWRSSWGGPGFWAVFFPWFSWPPPPPQTQTSIWILDSRHVRFWRLGYLCSVVAHDWSSLVLMCHLKRLSYKSLFWKCFLESLWKVTWPQKEAMLTLSHSVLDLNNWVIRQTRVSQLGKIAKQKGLLLMQSCPTFYSVYCRLNDSVIRLQSSRLRSRACRPRQAVTCKSGL
jgi:hypothetical protein